MILWQRTLGVCYSAKLTTVSRTGIMKFQDNFLFLKDRIDCYWREVTKKATGSGFSYDG